MQLKAYIIILSLCIHYKASAFNELLSFPLEKGFAKIPFVSSRSLSQFEVVKEEKDKSVEFFCTSLNKLYEKKARVFPQCTHFSLSFDLKTKKGYPLLYKSFGEGSNTTLILGGVHGDELSAIYLAFHLIDFLDKHKEIYENKDVKVIVAPLVNPDGFFAKKPKRTNGMVDLNRNFLTLEWYEKSFLTKKSSYSRYFPGYFPNTEIETLFQKKLVKEFKPQKIISIHAPLGFLNYDGPSEEPENCDLDKTGFLQNKTFIKSISQKTNNYKIANYTFFTGSLGNYYGVERNIPTVTLELDSARILQNKKYWDKFLSGLLESIHYKFILSKVL